MAAVWRKWNSQRGASILVALLFLLVCMLAAASVLMAAGSNAGKLRSNQEEQQKYLTLSSALQLVCGELNDASYEGKYIYKREPVYKTITTTDSDGNTKSEEIFSHYKHTYTQMDGAFVCGLNGLNFYVLPLGERLDYLFSKQFTLSESMKVSGDEYEFDPKKYTAAIPAPEYTLTLQLAGDNLPSGLTAEVTITLTLEDRGTIRLLAELKDGDFTYAMEAELASNDWAEKLLTLSPQSENGEHTTKPRMTWALTRITKRTEEVT